MSFFHSLGRLASDIEKALKGQPKLALKLKSCKACNFYQNGYCKQTSPPTKILSEYYAQGCIYYTVETATVLEKIPTVEKVKEAKIYGIKGLGGELYNGNGDLEYGLINAVTILDVSGKSLTLEMLDVSFEHEDLILEIRPYDEDGGLSTERMKIPYTSEGSSTLEEPTPKNIRDYGCDFLLLNKDVANHYKICLNRKIRFPNGLLLKMINLNADEVARKYAFNVATSVEGE